MTRDHNLAKPNHTKPNQDILGPFIGLFDPFLGQKYQKPIVKDFKEYSPLKYIYVGYVFHWSYFWTNSLNLETLLTTCDNLCHVSLVPVVLALIETPCITNNH